MFEDADGRGWLLNPNSLAELLTRSLKDAPADDSGNGAVAGVGYREDPGLLLSRESDTSAFRAKHKRKAHIGPGAGGACELPTISPPNRLQ